MRAWPKGKSGSRGNRTAARNASARRRRGDQAAASTVQFLDLPAQHRALKRPLLAAIGRVLDGAQFILGPETTALEAEIAALCQARHGLGVNSGTDALVLALRALDLGPGDEVIVPDFTFIATASAVVLAGAVPVLADIEPDTFTLDPAEVEKKITPRTKAVIPVHLYGHPADLTSLEQVAHRHRLALIEDAAQALGARWQGRSVGAWGMAGCLSFFPTKNLGGLGDGGMVVTNDERLAARVRRLRQHGADRKYFHDEIGCNSRLDEIQAAALRVKLRHLARWNERRRSLAALYTRGLERLEIGLPRTRRGAEPVFHQYSVRVPAREALQSHLAERGIRTAVHYPLPLHRQPALAGLPSAQDGFPVSERAAQEVLCLPVAPEVSPAQARAVVAAIADFFRGRKP